jgi:purine nucleosidase
MSYQQKYLKYKEKYTALLPKQTGGNPPKKIIIDTDPGIDDALAILLALGHSDKVEVLALTTVFGNFPDVSILTDNAFKILNLAKKKIPVYEGASMPLAEGNLTKYICKTKTAQSVFVHGQDGLADLKGSDVLSTGGLKKEPEFAANAIIRLAREYHAKNDKITLITIGPLTNIALALMMCPELPSLLDSVIIMGGALFSPRGNEVNKSDANKGNAMPAAEANFFKDPLSAYKVLNADFDPNKLFLIPLDLTTLTNYSDLELYVKSDDTIVKPPGLKDGPITNFIARTHDYYSGIYLKKFFRNKVPFHDCCAVFLAISPESFTQKFLVHIDIETKGEFTYGMSVIDNRGFAQKNITFCKTIDTEALYQAIIKAMNNLQ